MEAKRRFTIKIPTTLLSQIESRAKFNGRSRNAEAIYLINYALNRLDGHDAIISQIEGEKIQAGLYIERDLFDYLEMRASNLHRRLGPELVRLMTYAIDVITKQDLDLIRSMVHEDQSRRQTQVPETAESLLE